MSKPHSTLKKKSASIAYHFVREGVAKDEWRTTYLNTDLNPADMLTKSLPGGDKRRRFTSYSLHYVDCVKDSSRIFCRILGVSSTVRHWWINLENFQSKESCTLSYYDIVDGAEKSGTF